MRSKSRSLVAYVFLGLVTLVLSACTPATQSPTLTKVVSTPPPTATPGLIKLPQGADAVWHLVILSDSSLWGVGDAFATLIEQETGVDVVVEDFALGSSSAGQVLQALQTGKSINSKLEKLPDVLKDAEIVVMFLNPNDSYDSEHPYDYDGCFLSSAPKTCDPVSFEKWTSDLKAIWGEILQLREGHETILRAVDLYNPLVSPWKENGVFESCTECWENMSNAVRLSAEAYNIPMISRLDAFNGVNRDEDPRLKGYMGPDGEHLSDLGAQYTAELLAQMGYEPIAANNTSAPQVLEITPTQPAANDTVEWFSSDQLGLCFAYPQGYIQVPYNDTVEIVAPQLPDTDLRAVFWIEKSDAYDRSAEVIANQDLDLAGVNADRWDLTIDGEPAVVLDGMPGQDLQRRVYVVHEQSLYVLAFMPTLSQTRAANDQTDTLYETITSSWTWSPCPVSE